MHPAEWEGYGQVPPETPEQQEGEEGEKEGQKFLIITYLIFAVVFRCV